MAISPASGALSQTQLAVLEQIRSLRAAKAAAPVQPTAPLQSAAPVQAKPIANETPPAPPLAISAAAGLTMAANRPRGSILNITV